MSERVKSIFQVPKVMCTACWKAHAATPKYVRKKLCQEYWEKKPFLNKSLSCVVRLISPSSSSFFLHSELALLAAADTKLLFSFVGMQFSEARDRSGKSRDGYLEIRAAVDDDTSIDGQSFPWGVTIARARLIWWYCRDWMNGVWRTTVKRNYTTQYWGKQAIINAQFGLP